MDLHATSTPTQSRPNRGNRATPEPLEIEPLREITGEDVERAKERAHELRAQAMQEMVIAAAAWVRTAGQRLVSLLANPGARGAPCRDC